ncbi:hypothetical protein C2I36_05130 [Rhodobacteraceae bacterium WD3A24]|nr:hypothetical protein C2I36_05130 [Rhodobacteraceae bacterium WD3A24]
MFIYPWDVEDEGPRLIGQRLRAAGISAIAVATSYHAGKFLRPHAEGAKVYYPEDGTIYFRHSPKLYGRLKPKRARIAEGYDALSDLAHHAPDLEQSAWTVALHNSRLGRAHPDLVCRNAYGDPIWSALCPAQPDVQDYLLALCLDQATNPSVTDILIEAPGFQAYRHNDHHEFELIELTRRAASLLGLCFCSACAARAKDKGIDVDGFAARARRELDRFFSSGEEEPNDLIDDPAWQQFIGWRMELIANMVSHVRTQLPARVSLSVIPTVRTPLHTCWREGADLSRLAAAADRLAIPIYSKGPTATAAEISQARALAGPNARLSFILRPSWPTLEGPKALATAMEAAGHADAEAVDFYNYGHLRLSSLDWIGMQVL